jgi:hypothetical protein
MLQHGGENEKKLAPAWSFISAAGGRTNVLVVVDTHSDSYSGLIVHSSSGKGTKSADISEVRRKPWTASGFP